MGESVGIMWILFCLHQDSCFHDTSERLLDNQTSSVAQIWKSEISEKHEGHLDIQLNPYIQLKGTKTRQPNRFEELNWVLNTLELTRTVFQTQRVENLQECDCNRSYFLDCIILWSKNDILTEPLVVSVVLCLFRAAENLNIK